uniref:Gustatory receptor n=1 Tax=Anopheles gambiae TaxID=7165 RepID=A0A2Y9D2C9_ANOGA
MGIFRELHVLLTIYKCCSLVPYVPPRPARENAKRVYRCFRLRIVLALGVILFITWLRAQILTEYSLFLNSLSYVMWLLASTVDTIALSLLLIANGINVTHYGTLIKLLDRIEGAIDRWPSTATTVNRSPAYPPYRWMAMVGVCLCTVYYWYGFFSNFEPDISLVLQIRWELLLVDVYVVHVFLLLLAMGRCAKRLQSMYGETVQRADVTNLCAVLRLRDDLLHCVTLVNRIYGILFLGISASLLISMTCVVYFDFVYTGLQFYHDQPYLVEHSVMLLWKCVLTGGLLAVAGSVAEQIQAITQISWHCTFDSVHNRPLAAMVDKLHYKCLFQDVRFTVYGLFTIDSSLSYMVVSSIVTYLVIVTQFRQLEVDKAAKRMGRS